MADIYEGKGPTVGDARANMYESLLSGESPRGTPDRVDLVCRIKVGGKVFEGTANVDYAASLSSALGLAGLPTDAKPSQYELEEVTAKGLYEAPKAQPIQRREFEARPAGAAPIESSGCKLTQLL